MQPLKAEPTAAQRGKAELLAVLGAIQLDFGTKLTPRQLARRLDTTAHSSESLGVWTFEPTHGSMFEVEANAMSMDSPIDWLRITMRSELEVHLTDLTQLFSRDYDMLRGGAEFVSVEFTPNGRMHVGAELQSDRPAYISPVVSVQLRRPGYDPSVAKLDPAAPR